MNLERQLRLAAGHALHAAGAFRAAQRFALPEAVAIAMYHGLTRTPLPVSDWCFTSVATFAQHMEYLARYFTVLHVEEALAPDRPATARPTACVTFDDGFASVYDCAFPVLERLRIPATVYLVTDFVDSDATIWFARLHQALTETHARAIAYRGARFSLADGAARAAASARLQCLLKELPAEELEASLESILGELRAGSAPRPVPPAFRVLSSQQIRRMARADLIRFGAHSATHAILTRVSPERAQHEIERSVSAVRQLVDRPSATFAYPNGRSRDFDGGAVEGLRRAGIRYGLTTVEGPNLPGTDRFHIRRYGIGAEDPVARFSGLMHHSRAAARSFFGFGQDPQ